jgi:thiol-disulfide isomerase/thioredoxin
VRVLVLVLLLASTAAADPLIGDRAPSLPGQTLDGVVVVDFSATWCPSCLQAEAALDALVRRLGGRVRLIVVDVGEPKERVQAFVAAHPLPPGAQLVLDESGELARQWGQHRFPTTFLVGDGVIRHINRGYGPGYPARIDRWLSAMLR